MHHDFLKKKDIIDKVGEQKENAAIEMAKVVDKNKAIRDQVNKDLEEAAVRRAEELAIELAKRNELIRQIRDLERIPI